jgi:hypothetical protein
MDDVLVWIINWGFSVGVIVLLVGAIFVACHVLGILAPGDLNLFEKKRKQKLIDEITEDMSSLTIAMALREGLTEEEAMQRVLDMQARSRKEEREEK